MKRQEGTTIPKRYYNRLIFFFVEMSYWASYYEKWKSEKQISLIVGVAWVAAILFSNILTIISIVDLCIDYSIADNLPSPSSNGVFTAKDRLILILKLLPLWLLLEYFIINWIYKRASKKELFGYFEKMPPHRQARGKLMFITYSLCSIILVFVFGIQVTNKRESLQESGKADRDRRLELILKEVKEGTLTDTITKE